MLERKKNAKRKVQKALIIICIEGTIMKVLLEFWGELHDFAISEIKGILEGEKEKYELLEDDFPVLVIDVKEWQIFKRAGFLSHISRYIASSDSIPAIDLETDSFAVRSRVYFGLRDTKSNKLEVEIGKKIRGQVNLENPERVIRVPVARRIHVGIELYDFKNEGFEHRKPSKMPISYPITMHPRYTRALINIARVKNGDRILDPFCGTGAMMIEALLMGFRVKCSDIDKKMLKAAELNMKNFGVEAEIEKLDVGEVSGNYDAIITDPPYGRSSSLRGEKIYELYCRAFKKFSELTDKVAIVLPNEKSIKIGKKFFKLEEKHPVRVHKSLTRYYCLFERE